MSQTFYRCDYCGTPVPEGFEVRRHVERWRYDEYNSGACFQRIETDVICPRCGEANPEDYVPSAEQESEVAELSGCFNAMAEQSYQFRGAE